MNEQVLTEFMKSQGFERMDDYSDMGGCSPPIGGKIFQFYNPSTKEGVQFCIGDASDDLMFGEDFQEEIEEKWGNG